MKKLVFLVTLFSSQLHAGTIADVEKRSSLVRTAQVDAPNIDQISEVDVGESLISSALEEKHKSITLTRPISTNLVSLFATIEVTAQAGVGLFAGENKDAYFYILDKGRVKGFPERKAALLVPKKIETDTFQLCMIGLANVHTCEKIDQLAEGKDFSYSEISRFALGSFKQEIVYSGRSQNSITLLYREFKDNLARPAFSQELKYDISDDKIIGYKGARFEVIEASNVSLKYKVIQHLRK
jgi:hypothetical protein